jgi:hypothetical protein
MNDPNPRTPPTRDEVVQPSVLYHYTSPSGFAGIVQRSELWATDVRFLNDAQELHYAWDAFRSTLADREAEGTEYSEAYKAELEAIKSVEAENIDAMEMRIFAACLSELPDDVPQWRSYASDGRGVALGFNFDSIHMLKVPYFQHTSTGDLVPARATVSGTDTQVDVTWGAFCQNVGYGDAARENAIDIEIWRLEQHCGTNDVGTLSQRMYNCIHLIPVQLEALALVKHDGFKSEQEWRITTQEHFGSSTLSQLRALNRLEGIPKMGGGLPLETVDVRFREGGPALFKPYTAMPFEKSALVQVVLGPNVNAELATPVIRRLLDRHGFRETEIVPSSMPYRT